METLPSNVFSSSSVCTEVSEVLKTCSWSWLSSHYQFSSPGIYWYPGFSYALFTCDSLTSLSGPDVFQPPLQCLKGNHAKHVWGMVSDSWSETHGHKLMVCSLILNLFPICDLNQWCLHLDSCTGHKHTSLLSTNFLTTSVVSLFSIPTTTASHLAQLPPRPPHIALSRFPFVLP